MLGRLAFLVAKIWLEHFRFGSKKYTHVSSPVTKFSKAFLLYFGYFFNKSLAFPTWDLFWLSVSKCNIQLAKDVSSKCNEHMLKASLSF
jgi:hypothetical protein